MIVNGFCEFTVFKMKSPLRLPTPALLTVLLSYLLLFYLDDLHSQWSRGFFSRSKSVHLQGKRCDVISVFSLKKKVWCSLQLRMLGTTAFPAELTSV